MGERMHIVLVMADQMTPGALPIYGHRLTIAPQMQELAAGRRGVRRRLLQQPALLALARGVHVGRACRRGPAAYDNAAEFRSDIPTFAHYLRRRRLPDDPVGQDAFLRTRPAARLRGAADDRHLPGRFRLDAGLGAAGRAAELVPQHGLGHRRRARASAPTSSTSTTRSSSRPSGRSTTTRAAATSGRSAWSSR